MLKKVCISIIFLLVCLSFAVTYSQAATYHVLSAWCVDSGKHLDRKGSSQYLSYFNTGVNTWNNYKSGVIRADGAFTVNDVTISDVSDLDGNTVALTSITAPFGNGHGTGTIQFATSKMNKLSSLKKTIVCTHEIGHALGLSENNDNGTNVIMYNDMTYNTSNNVLHSQDKLNYDYMYNNKY